HDELGATASPDERLILYTVLIDGLRRPRIYDMQRRTVSVARVFQGRAVDVGRRDVSPDQRLVLLDLAAAPTEQRDLMIYELGTGTVVTPPFINTEADEFGAKFSPDGRRIVFVSDRNGSLDLFVVDLATGLLDQLPLVNTDRAEFDPEFTSDGQGLLFVSDRDGTAGIYMYHWALGVVDTLPIVNEPDAEELL
ncbi:MAG: TolB family protein, partial [Candidatus Sericytochromatia bacterium]